LLRDYQGETRLGKRPGDLIQEFSFHTDAVKQNHTGEGALFGGGQSRQNRNLLTRQALIGEILTHVSIPLLAHTGILMRICMTPGQRVNSRWMRPICLDAVVRSFPALNVVGAHLGVPWHEEASMLARMHPNYYVDLTGAFGGGWRVNKGPEFFRYHFFWENAWDKVLFGTDILKLQELIPSKQYHDNLISQLGLPDDVVRKIYGGTAARLLGIEFR